MKYQSCNYCSGTRYTQIRPYPGFEGVELVVCDTCGLMQAQPVPPSEFLEKYYQSTFGNSQGAGFEMPDTSEKGFRLRATLQFNFVKTLVGVEPAREGQKRVLDVGCHAASFLSLFKERGWDVTGVDPNPRSRYGDKWYGIKVIETMFKPGMFPDNSFDAILHSHSLEHVSDPKGVLEEFRRVLRPGGWVFIEVPNESLDKVRTQKVIPHLYFFTPETLDRLASAAGFEVLSTCVLGIGTNKGKIFTPARLRWLRLRWQARYDARGRMRLETLLPFYGRLFKKDRYFKCYTPQADMLRALLRKPLTQGPTATEARLVAHAK